ncbi:MAG: leucyl aminopeptidase [Alphaproteobacteria bacterium]|nr:leucyl aminopeptidase [Alphaproteobacteria bacterium]
MTVDITFSKSAKKNIEAAILCFYKDKKTFAASHILEPSYKRFVDHALKKSKGFSGKSGQIEVLMLPDDMPHIHIVLAGCGEAKEFEGLEAEKLGGKLFVALEKHKIESAEIYADCEHENTPDLAAHIAGGLKLRSYKFEHYQSKKEDEDPKIPLKKFHMVLDAADKASKHFSRLNCMIEGTFFARDLVNEPPNELYPEVYAKRIQKELKPLGVEIEILDENKMKKLGMGALLAVGQGSDFVPRMVIMRWKGNKTKKDAPIAFVGKGVTFDTGGISIKPGPGMEEMKMDMGGSAAVVGLMKSLALRQSKANVVGIVGLVENMPSARAYRPADIIKSYSGKTIEVLNTDAEGRLVLADALSYVQDIYKPKVIVDLATLTGAMIVALGHEFCGTFATDDELWAHMEQSSAKTGEKLWRMPLDPEWKKEMEGTMTDLQNMAKSGRGAGACTAAGFLWHFVKKDVKWAHMDIAGTAWVKKDRDTVPKYGTGFGVRVLDQMVADYYE